MNRLAIAVLAGVVSISVISCRHVRVKGEGETKTENRTVGSFNAIQLSAPLKANIKIDPAAAPSVRLSGYANILSKIKTEIKGNTLVIDKEGWDWDLDKDVIADITLPSINALTISGAADANVEGNVTGNDFNLKVSGAGDVDIANLNVANFTTSLSGAGDLSVNSGNVTYASYKVAGAGDIDVVPLTCKQAKAVVSGAGDINLSASEKLDVHLSGAGSVKYKGSPVVTSDINGIGSVENVN